MPDLSGRTALVTGGSRGIGRAICVALAGAGADVAINYASNAEAAEETAQAVRAIGRRAEAYQADIAGAEACEAMAQAALADLGPIDILVNNAGIGSASVGRPIVAETPAEDMQRLFDVHTMGSLHMCKLLVPQMRERERGDVVMISSVAAQGFGANGGVYNVAKAGMEALAYTLAREERQHGIRVNIVAPGLVDTEMGLRLVRHTGGVEDMRTMDARSPFGFVCTPEDIANAVAFLCSDGARYMTGQRLTVSGGGA